MSTAWEQLFDLLVVDKDQAFVRALGAQVQPAGFAVHTARDLDEARTRLQVMAFDFIVIGAAADEAIDVEALVELHAGVEGARLVVILPQALESYEDALRQAGLIHIVSRELALRQIARYLTAQGEIRNLEMQNYKLRQMLDGRTGYKGLIGGSAPMRSIYKLLDQIARTDSPILVTGEEGTERVDVARAIHQKSDRANQPLVVVDCGDGVDDPEGVHLFGTMGRGNFSTGPNPRNSAFARAGQGTVVLHRVEMLGPMAQQRLLDFMHKPFFQNETPSHAKPLARIMVTAGSNLLGKVEAGDFLRELFYRLNILQARIPPLRERREDIPLLAHHFLRVAGRRAGDRSASYSFSGQALLMMFEYEWPGNLEELRDVVQEIAKKTQGPMIEVADLPLKLQSPSSTNGSLKPGNHANIPLKEAKRLFESEYFTGLLKYVRGNMTMASRYSRVGRPYLYKKIREYGLEPEEFR